MDEGLARHATACPHCDAIIGPESVPAPADISQCPRCFKILVCTVDQVWRLATEAELGFLTGATGTDVEP